MTLPELPEMEEVWHGCYGYSLNTMKAYGESCYRAALKDSIDMCNVWWNSDADFSLLEAIEDLGAAAKDVNSTHPLPMDTETMLKLAGECGGTTLRKQNLGVIQFYTHELHKFVDAIKGVRSMDTLELSSTEKVFDGAYTVGSPLADKTDGKQVSPVAPEITFGMRGTKMRFQIGNQGFTLDYEPEEPGEFEFMAKMLTLAFTGAADPVGNPAGEQTHVSEAPTRDMGIPVTETTDWSAA